MGARQVIVRTDHFMHTPYTLLHLKIHTEELVRPMQVRYLYKYPTEVCLSYQVHLRNLVTNFMVSQDF